MGIRNRHEIVKGLYNVNDRAAAAKSAREIGYSAWSRNQRSAVEDPEFIEWAAAVDRVDPVTVGWWTEKIIAWIEGWFAARVDEDSMITAWEEGERDREHPAWLVR